LLAVLSLLARLECRHPDAQRGIFNIHSALLRWAKRVILPLLIYENKQTTSAINSMKSIFEIVRYHVEKLPADKPVLIGIDGTDGSGKSRFAANLAACFADHTDRCVVMSSVDFFHNPKSVRHQDCKPTHISFFEDSFNYSALQKKLLDPIKHLSGKAFYRKHFDHKIDREVDCPSEIARTNILLIFEGIFVHRDEIKDYWDFSVFLDVPFEETYRRMAERDGCSPNPVCESNARYYLGQKLYIDTCNPKKRASMIVDNTDYDNPIVIEQNLV